MLIHDNLFKVGISNGKILIVNSEIRLQPVLVKQLSLIGYKVILASHGKEALITFAQEKPDLVIIDIFLSKMDGYAICQKIRKNSQIPIILLTPVTNISARISGFEAGADDYIVKPFSHRELEVKIKVLLIRSNIDFNQITKKRQEHLKIYDPIVEIGTKIAKKLRLTNLEYNLLELLIKNSGKELSRKMILNSIWGYTPERYIDTRIVDVNISRLRSKIEKNPSKPDFILTVRGIGYMFQPNIIFQKRN